ncbi:MAG: hypothetical protein KC593_21165 [Myxococcales bacterium]|nr:hypothetical protein [Myxococcales bacterium]MCB9626982.1 hypothetical protein [Sandaracinaceae bacterium]
MRIRSACLLYVLTLAAGCGGGDEDPPPLDTVPDTRFESAPGAGLNSAEESAFTLACDQPTCTFECSLDDAAYAPCDATLVLDHLSAGDHTLAARAVDPDGDVDPTPATHSWSLAFGWRALATTETALCAISGEGGLYCWGHEEAGQLGNGGEDDETLGRAAQVGTATDWETIVGGEYSFCGRRAGATYCWGANWDDQLGDPSLADVTSTPTAVAHDFEVLALGSDHGCGIDSAGALYCWGSGSDGALGLGDEEDVAAPTRVGTGLWTTVSAGNYATCAIDVGGALYCWGGNYSGEGGQDPVTELLLTPTRVGLRTDWSSVVVGDGQACALDATDGLWCWGSNYEGQLGIGSTMPAYTHVPMQVPGVWRDVVAADGGACAVATDGLVSCWGDNRRAQLGRVNALVEQSPSPLRITHSGRFTSVVGRYGVHCALSSSEIVCWGDNQWASGGLGRGVLGGEPQVIAIDTGFSQVAVSHTGGCGLRVDGSLACWGVGPHVGQEVPLSYAPAAVSADLDWTDVDVTAAGTIDQGHACGVRAGAVYCWGSGEAGQIGDGGAQRRAQPTLVDVPGVTFTQVSTGTNSTCAVAADTSLHCWGGGTNSLPFARSNYGQVGDGTETQRNTPVAVTTPAATGWLSVHVFAARATAVRSDGTLWAWGQNPNGVGVSVPTQIGTDTDWVEGISTASGTTCARKASGAMYCTDYTFNSGWARGLLQVESALDHSALVAFEGGACSLRAGVLHCYWGTNTGWADNFPSFDVNGNIPNPTGVWSSFSAGYGLRCGVRTDGSRECAGSRFAGSLGDGFDERLPTAILLP